MRMVLRLSGLILFTEFRTSKGPMKSSSSTSVNIGIPIVSI